jgi:hypothetical protein
MSKHGKFLAKMIAQALLCVIIATILLALTNKLLNLFTLTLGTYTYLSIGFFIFSLFALLFINRDHDYKNSAAGVQ